VSVDAIQQALTGFLLHVVPEVILGLVACILFLGATWRIKGHVWGLVALLGLAAAGLALAITVRKVPTMEALRAGMEQMGNGLTTEDSESLTATLYAAPLLWTRLAVFFKVVALIGGAVLVLIGWDEAGEHTAEYQGCVLLIVAGTCLSGAANDLVTLFLALELVSIPTYILLYLPREDPPAQEAAMKYFLLSVFSSGLLLFGFSYLYGITGTTNISAITEALARARADLPPPEPNAPAPAASWPGLALIALVMVVAGLGFKITAVPFHFYAPDVYQGTTTAAAALLAFLPKVVGFAALLRVLGLVPTVLGGTVVGQAMGEQIPMLLWIMSAVTMSLGNLLALLQDNIKRMLAYSSVAHAGYMLIGLAVAPRLAIGGAPGEAVGGVEAVLFYILAYGAMTVGAFAILHYLSSPERPVENVDDLAGLGKSHPGLALLMVVFLFSLIGIPLTAGFMGKFFLFFDAMGLSTNTAGLPEDARRQVLEQVRLYRILALIAAINAAVGAWYYLRVATVMYLREGIEPLPKPRPAPVLVAIWVCVAFTLGLGIYPTPIVRAVRSSIPHPEPAGRAELPLEPDRFAQRQAR
jgi:NADH-quinone oxidoreductase subunit N